MHNNLTQKNQTFSSFLTQSQIPWHKDSLLFSSPDTTLIGSGIALSMELDDDETVSASEQIHGLLQRAKKQGSQPIVLGALAFDGHSRSRFIVPEILQTVPSGSLRKGLITSQPKGYDLKSMHYKPQPEAYMNGVKQVLAKIRTGSLEKVVLARLLELEMEQKISIISILNQLMCQPVANYVFSLPPLPASKQEDTVFLGASPELLIYKYANTIYSNPLAGSIATAADQERNTINRQRLLNSEKDRREHEFASRAVVEALHPFCSCIDIPITPDIVSAGPVMHLSTRITGILKTADSDSLTLAQHLHPTPAVCGTPRLAAKQAINKIEKFNRGLYSGIVGWCDDEGNGEWAVTLRCAEIKDNRACLFSGAGVVEASCPESELQETNTKLKTMLNVLGINDLNTIEATVPHEFNTNFL